MIKEHNKLIEKKIVKENSSSNFIWFYIQVFFSILNVFS
jgi:hypothetical protein